MILKYPKKNLYAKIEIKEEKFLFDNAYDHTSSDQQIFDQNCVNIITNAVEGGVGTIIAFGQTGSGKTYTITNMVHQVCTLLYSHMAKLNSKYNSTQTYSVFYKGIEILGSKSTDLQYTSNKDYKDGNTIINTSINKEKEPKDITNKDKEENRCNILENKYGKIEVTDCVENEVRSAEDLESHITRAMNYRSTCSTGKNNTSSRSHAINIVRIRNNVLKESEDGLLYLIDLAGSERNADSSTHDKERIKESREINTSLMNLKDCIRHRTFYLVDDKYYHIPFRANKLSLILKEMLDVENRRVSKSLFICCISPSKEDVGHTQNSLKYSVCLYTTGFSTLANEYDEKDPSTWSNAQLKVNIRKYTKHAVDVDILCADQSGKQLLDLPECEFLSRCDKFGMTGMAAKNLYTKYWSLYIDIRHRKRKDKITMSECKKQAIKEKKALKEMHLNEIQNEENQEQKGGIQKQNTCANVKGKIMLGGVKDSKLTSVNSGKENGKSKSKNVEERKVQQFDKAYKAIL